MTCWPAYTLQGRQGPAKLCKACCRGEIGEDCVFTFCGKALHRDEAGVLHLGQRDFAETLELIEMSKDRRLQLASPATPTEMSDNRSALGALGWLATQTRPGLAAGVAMAQRHQSAPTVADVLETNRLIKQARRYSDATITIPRLQGELCLVCYHDASWANAEESDAAGGIVAAVKSAVGTMTEKICSRGGQATASAFTGRTHHAFGRAYGSGPNFGHGRAMVLDWRSATLKRVCRSTFAAETMTAVDALGTSLTTRAACVWPDVTPADVDAQLMEIQQVTDCASLYDAIHKDGTVSLPPERRLLLDLVGYR
eukprot:GHVR01149767.1.p1 GENE.GHVR01149767.1~~GHVR01149767.1.p1  ORF type:complete len:312 (-),score=42.04 GHVR01149767.1:210-1145(-)